MGEDMDVSSDGAALRKARSMGHAKTPVEGKIPPPPYQLRGCTFLMVGATFDREVAARIVPPELEVVDEATGGYYFYTAPKGWGIAPYTATVVWIDIKGHDSADGSYGRYMVYGGYSGAACEALSYNASIVRGQADINVLDETIEGSGGPGDQPYLRMAVRKASGAPIAADGTHYYLGRFRSGGLCSAPVAFSYDLHQAVPEYVEILAPPDSDLGRLKPEALTWAAWLTNGVITIGRESAISDAPATEKLMSGTRYLNFLTQVGKAAVAVRADDSILFQNAAAEQLAGDGYWLDNGRFRVSDKSAGAWIEAKQHVQNSRDSVLGRRAFGLARQSSLTPLVAQLVPLDDAIVVLLTDPDDKVEKRPTEALQILGLTPAESRIGALIGEGLDARSVGERLNISVATVRSAAKSIYQKLGVNKQSELSKLVARLASTGV